MTLLYQVERHLRDSGERRCSFGRRVARDPNLVGDLRRGREPGQKLRSRILSQLDTTRPG